MQLQGLPACQRLWCLWQQPQQEDQQQPQHEVLPAHQHHQDKLAGAMEEEALAEEEEALAEEEEAEELAQELEAKDLAKGSL